MAEKIGIVGVGNMGTQLLYRLRLAGESAVTYDVAPEARDRARALDASVAESAAAVARAATIVDVVVRTEQDMLDATLGRDGVLAGAAPGTLVLLHSTILPRTTRQVAEAGAAQGVHVIDACMVGVPAVVRAGNLNFVVGGPPELFERAKPHLLKMGKAAFHMGPLGAGNVTKLIKNMTTGAEALILEEAVRIGMAGGLGARQILETFQQVYSGTVLDRWESAFVFDDDTPRPHGRGNLYEKDLPLAVALAHDLGVMAPIAESLRAAGERALAAEGVLQAAGGVEGSRS
ncbi:MAG TPA: NAD(P)-binding domain-containing protein [Chloroflexota bacterium]|nr:NAD(P)-binding domain-containing protein [Chloroflexota bacterium]